MKAHAKGPNINTNINMSSSFHGSLLSSTMNRPRNFEHRYAESVGNQRSIYNGGDTSPTGSIRSDFYPRNFQQPYYPSSYREPHASRSVYNGRSCSPMSFRSMDSNASVATDIAKAINNGNFNKYEWRIIQQAYYNRKKNQIRRKAEKRRKMKLYFKNIRNRSGDDSGEQGSNSSNSSDDCRSVKTGYSRYTSNYKENVPRITVSYDSQSVDLADYRKESRTTGMYRENEVPYQQCQRKDIPPPHFDDMPYQNNMRNGNGNMFSFQKNMYNSRSMYSAPRDTLNLPRNFLHDKNTMNASICSSIKNTQNMSMTSQKERFKSGFMFPSQRFNKSISSLPIPEERAVQQEKNRQVNKRHTTIVKKNSSKPDGKVFNDDSDDNGNEIFLNTSVKQTNAQKNPSTAKRNIDSLDEVSTSAKKKRKLTSPKNNNAKQKVQSQSKNVNNNNDFVFAKPQFPVKKSTIRKPCEKIVPKSVQSNVDIAPEVTEKDNKEIDEELEETDSVHQSTTDISMRPSFMKRKLFTQTFDVTEKKNTSSDSLSVDSPQSNIYSQQSRERHKTRKLVSSQSLMSRDVLQDDNNLLDLIHKIVPPDQVNTTNASSKFSAYGRVSGQRTTNDNDKWDITSIISTCNNDSRSDTYTDDEIFNLTNDTVKNKTKEKSQTAQEKPKPVQEKLKPEKPKVGEEKAKVVPEKTKSTNEKPQAKPTKNDLPKKCRVVLKPIKVLPTITSPPTRDVLSRVESFWNTDIESDFENAGTPQKSKGALSRTNSSKQTNLNNNKNYLETANNISEESIKINTNEKDVLVVNKNDSPLVKTLKKQTNKKNNKQEKPTKKNVDVSPKTTKQNFNITNVKKNPLRRHSVRLSNLSASTISNDSGLTIKNATTPATRRRQTENKKHDDNNKLQVQQTKVKSTKNRAKDDKASVEVTSSKSRPREEKNKANSVKDKVSRQDVTLKMDLITKVLRSREVDLSSSFNSDKFDLTRVSNGRASRTPNKKILFNKSRNITFNEKKAKKSKT